MNPSIPKISLWLLFISVILQSVNTQAQQRHITLLFAGDIMGHDSQIKSAAIKPGKLYDYTPAFEYVKPIVENADLAIANLELTLPGKPPYKGYPQFRSPDELALALRDAGFDMLLTANNHSNDAGKQGLINTINTLQRYNFFQTGTFKNAADREFFYPLVVYKNDFKLAFLNYTYGTNGLRTRPPTIVNLIDENQMKKDMAAARALEPDAIIVIIHWGTEYQVDENPKQRKLADTLFGWGADIIVGAHPHVVQPIREKILTRGGKPQKGLVAYSLGNYISGQTRRNTDGGIMLEVELKKNISSGEVSLNNYAYIPVWRYRERLPSGKRNYRVLPVQNFENKNTAPHTLPDADYKAMMDYTYRLRVHLNKSDCREKNNLKATTKK